MCIVGLYAAFFTQRETERFANRVTNNYSQDARRARTPAEKNSSTANISNLFVDFGRTCRRDARKITHIIALSILFHTDRMFEFD